MKKILVLLIAVLFIKIAIFAQGRPGPPGQSCEENPSRIDSVYSFTWNTLTQSWDNTTIQHRIYNNDLRIEDLTLNFADRSIIRSIEYHYDNNSSLFQTSSFNFTSGQKQSVQNVEYFYDEWGVKTHQKIFDWRNSSWIFRGQYVYTYDNQKLSYYTYQRPDQNQQLFDFGQYYYIYQSNKVLERYGIRLPSGDLLWRRYYYYDSGGKLEYVIFYEPVINAVTGETILEITQQSTYIYDQYGLTRETINQKMTPEGWENTTRTINFRRIDNATKVRICFNGNSQCVPKSNLLNFLNRGATLGACPLPVISQGETEGSTPATGNLKSSESVQFYPNPANESINVFAGESFSRVELINSNGQTVRAFPLQNGDLTVIERNGLPSGIYFLRFVGQEEVKTEKVIFK